MRSLYREFKDGSFLVNTRANTFYKTAKGQAQDHKNKKISQILAILIKWIQKEKRFLQKFGLCRHEVQ